jgi:hypothetical protein
MNHLTNTAEVGLLKERISHLEETRLLYRRINDLEVNVIHQKIDNLERTVNNMNHITQNIRYHAPVTQPFVPQPVQPVYQQGQNYSLVSSRWDIRSFINPTSAVFVRWFISFKELFGYWMLLFCCLCCV